MNAPILPLPPEVLLGARSTQQPNLDIASEGAQRYVWQSAYGVILIDVRDGTAFVNGARVASMAEWHGAVA
jgi:hypothetical protein